MFESKNEDINLQEIAIKLVTEQKKSENTLNGPKERTIFILGSKGVVSMKFSN